MNPFLSSPIVLLTTAVALVAAPGPRVPSPAARGYAIEAIRDAGERGGRLLTVGTNFSPAYNKAMGDAIALWNAHRWDEAVAAFRSIRLSQPDSPWAAEAELHEACYLKYTYAYDAAEERFLSLLRKYPDDQEIRRRVLRYLPHLYAQTGRYQTALDLLDDLRRLPLNWQERQYLENYSRVFARANGRDEAERLCGTKALALALAAQTPDGQPLRNVSLEAVFARHPWASERADHPRGFSLDDLARRAHAQPVQMDFVTLKNALRPGQPILVHLREPAPPRAFSFFPKPNHTNEPPLSGHFVVVESISDARVDLLDPDLGRTRWPLGHFLYRWSGAALRLPGQTLTGARPLNANEARALRGGCCGSPPPDPTDECEEGDGEDLCPCEQTHGGGPGTAFGGGCHGCNRGLSVGGYGAPVYSFGLSSANFRLRDTPIWSEPARGPRLQLTLYYNRIATQRMAANGTNVQYFSFGEKWHCNFLSHLTATPGNNTIDIVLPGGRVQRFFFTNCEPVDLWNRNTLTLTSNHYILTFHHSGNRWFFNTQTLAEQRLERIEDKYGDALVLQYDETNGRLTNVVDALGRFFRFTYDGNGRVTNVADAFGRHAAFAYQDGNLVSLTDMGGLTTTLQYDTNRWPTNITYPNNQTWHIAYQQGAYGYVDPFRITVVDPQSQTNEYFYHAFFTRGPATVRDKAGNLWSYAIEQLPHPGGDGGAHRVKHIAVNVEIEGLVGSPWEHRNFDLNGNLLASESAAQRYMSSLWGGPIEPWASGSLTTNFYDAHNNLLSATLLTNDGSSLQIVGTWTNWYDARHNRLGTKNPKNQTTTYGYDAFDRLVAVTNALNQVTRMAYDAHGNLTNLVDALLRTNRWTYDLQGRNFETFHADGLRISRGYDTVGRLAAVTNHGSGLYLRYAYDHLNRLRDTVFPDGTTNHAHYSCCGLDYTRDRLNRVTLFGRDALGRTTSVTDPANRTVQFAYNGADQITHLTTTVDGQTRTKRFDYTPTNGFSRLTRVTTPMGKLLKYDYTFRGGLAWRQDGNGRITKFHYDHLERLTSVTDSNDLELVRLDYDVLGNLTNVVSPHALFTYSYDALNRATQAVCTLTNLPGMATVRYRLDYAFDAVGNLTNRLLTGLQGMSGTLTTRYRYDVMNRLTNVVQLTNGVPAATASYAYDPAGRLHRKTYGNGDFATHAYDLESRLLSLAITNGTTPVERWTYGWNPVGHLLAITNQGTNLCLYAYDDADQLTNAVCFTNGLAGGATNAWHYDEAGNWRNASPTHQWFYNADNELLGRSATGDTNWTIPVTGQVEPGPASNKWYNARAACRGVTAPVNPATGTFTLPNVPLHGGSNELVVTVTDAGTNTWTTNRWVRKDAAEYFLYDGNGNLTNWVSGSTNWVYEWDWADRLVKASSNGVVMLENWYDATGRRIAKRERVGTGLHIRQYVWDGWESVALLLGTSGAVLESWTRGVGLAGDIGTLVAVTHHSGSTPGTYYTHHNHRGDVVLTRSGTTTIGRYEYSAFGAPRSALGPDLCRFKFSSKERDPATGWSYYGYRFYAPHWQRWPNRDPLGEPGFETIRQPLTEEYAGGPNLYAFVLNDPLGKVDYFGLAPGGPYHPPSGVSLSCDPSDSCGRIRAKMTLLMRMIASHTGWDRNMPPPRGGGRHADEIADLWRAYAKCQALHAAKKCQDPRPPRCWERVIMRVPGSDQTWQTIGTGCLVVSGVAVCGAVIIGTGGAATPVLVPAL